MHNEGERTYPWFFFYPTGAWAASFFTVLLVCIVAGVFYFWYSHFGSDPSPDSIVGLIYAVMGTSFLVLAAVMYSLRRRSRKRGIGQLNAALQWHIAFGVMGLVLLFLHSFGNFNPRSGTFALYGMIALVISGFVGRMLDRLMPRLIAGEAAKALTAQGEDRMERISQELQDIVVHNTQELRGFSTVPPSSTPNAPAAVARGNGNEALGLMPSPGTHAQPLHTSWDLAYISLEETPQEVNLDASQYRFVPDRKSALAQPGALIPGARQHYSELQNVQQALQREQLYRYLIRSWRTFHVGLVLVTIGLTIWHLVYAAQLWLPVLFHAHG